MLVRDICHKPTFVMPDVTIDNLARIMAFKDIGSVIVGTAEEPLGIFSERDILKKIVSKGVSPKRAKVRDYMSFPIITIACDKPVVDAMRIIAEHHIKRLPVVSNGKIVGMLSARSIMENLRKNMVIKPSKDYNERKDTPGFW